MGRQLAFWKYEDGTYLDNREVYMTSCIEGKNVKGLVELPRAEILAKLNSTFSSYTKLDSYNFESAKSSFTVYPRQQSVLFDCSFSMPESELNTIIDIMLEYGCPYYDPQISIRFDGT